jgi:hypothetical protein
MKNERYEERALEDLEDVDVEDMDAEDMEDWEDLEDLVGNVQAKILICGFMICSCGRTGEPTGTLRATL